MTPQPAPGPLVDLELVVNARRRLEAALAHVAAIETAARALDELVNDPDDPVAKLELVAPERSTSAPAPPKPKPRSSAPAPASERDRRARHAGRSAQGASPDTVAQVRAYFAAHPGEWLKISAVATTLGLSRVTADRAVRELDKSDVLEHNGRKTTASRWRYPDAHVDEPPAEPEPPRPGNAPAIAAEDIPDAIRNTLRRIGPAAVTRIAGELGLTTNSVTHRRVIAKAREMADAGDLVIAGQSRGQPTYDVARGPTAPIEPGPEPEPDDELAGLEDDDGNPDDDEPIPEELVDALNNGDEPPFPEVDEPDPDDAIAPRHPAGPLTPPPGKMPSSAGLSPRTAKSVERAELEAAEAAANATRNGRSPAAERILESMLHGDGAGTITELAMRLDLPRRDVAAAIQELEEDETAGLCRAGKRAGNIVYTAID